MRQKNEVPGVQTRSGCTSGTVVPGFIFLSSFFSLFFALHQSKKKCDTIDFEQKKKMLSSVIFFPKSKKRGAQLAFQRKIMKLKMLVFYLINLWGGGGGLYQHDIILEKIRSEVLQEFLSFLHILAEIIDLPSVKVRHIHEIRV